MKKAEMSLQLIVTAVIVLIIAALIIYLVSSRIGLFSSSTGACYDRGGSCKSSCSPGEQPFYLGNVECEKSGGGSCCIDGDQVFGGN